MMRFTKILSSILIILAISGCNPDQPVLEPDNFHIQYMDVSSRYYPQFLKGSEDRQVAPWIKADGFTNGDPLVVMVKNWNKDDYKNTPAQLSAWSPWYGREKDGFHTLSELPSKLRYICEYSGNMCSPSSYIKKAPCIMTKGKGLYGLIANPNGDHPNTNIRTMKAPAGETFHLGEDRSNKSLKLYDINVNTGELEEANGIYLDYMKFNNSGELNFDFVDSKSRSSNSAVNYLNTSVYFKILDSYYGDNSGKYQIVIKSGLGRAKKGVIFDFIQVFKTTLFGVREQSSFTKPTGEATSNMFENLGKGDISEFATSGADIVRSIFTTERPSEYEGKVKAIFTNIVKNESYQAVIRTVTTLFVIITAISYLIGVTNVNQAMLIKNLFKIAVIHQLLTAESSWNFFYDNFFVLFIRGIDNFIGIMMGSILGAETNGLYVYDSILELLVGDAVFKKLVALLFSGDSFMDVFISIAFVIVFYIAVIYIFIAIGRAVVTYIIAMTTIGILILLFPIIFSFYLFSITSEIFENWLKILLTYTLQPILLMAGLSLITTVIIEDIYLQLGFRAWYHPTTVVPMPGSYEDFKINIWQPIYVSKENDKKANILIPRAHTKEDGTYCKPYECSENRYINYPYIDPNNEKHMDVLDNFHQKQFIQKKLLFELIVVVYLLRKFISYTDELARTLADTQESQTDVDTMRSGLGSSFGKMAAGGGVAAAALPAATAASSVSVGKKAVSSTPKIALRAAGKASRNLPKSIPLSMQHSRAESGNGLASAEDRADDYGEKKSKMAESSQLQQQKASDSMAKAEQSSSHHQQKAEQAKEKQQRFSEASGSKSKLKNLGAGISGKIQEKYHKSSSKAARLAGQSKGKFYDSKAKFKESKANKYAQKQGGLHKSIDIGQVVAQNKAMSRGKITKAILGEKVVKTKQVKEAKKLQKYRKDEDKLERLEKKSQDKAEQLKTTKDDSKVQKLQKKTSKAGANIESMYKFEGLRKKALQAKLNAKDDLNTRTTKKQDAKELARGIKGAGKDVKGILVNTLKTSKKVYSGISDQIDKGGIDLDPENFVKNKASKLSNYLGNWNEQRKQKWKKKQERFEQKEREKDKKNAEEIEKIKKKNKSRADEEDNRIPDYSAQEADAAPTKQEAEELAKARLASELKPTNQGPVDPQEEQASERHESRDDEISREESDQKENVSEDKDKNNNSAKNDERLNKESSEVQRLVREENIDIEEARKRDESNTSKDKSRNEDDNN